MGKSQARPDQQYDYAESRVHERYEHAELLSRYVWSVVCGHGHFRRPRFWLRLFRLSEPHLATTHRLA